MIELMQTVPMDRIEPNDYNPNQMPEAKLELLRRSIARDGYLQPIIVRKNDQKPEFYVLVDGEHRWRALAAEGIKEAECVVVDMDRFDAMISTLNMNNLRGNFDSIKLAEVVLSLNDRFDDKTIQELLGYSEQELSAFKDLAGFDFTAHDNKPPKEEKIDLEDAPGLFTIMLQPEELETVRKALAKKGMESDSAALVDICRQHLMKNHPKEYAKVEERAAKHDASQSHDSGVEVVTDEDL